MNTETQNPRSLVTDTRNRVLAKEADSSAESEKIASLREYQALLDKIDDLIREFNRVRTP